MTKLFGNAYQFLTTLMLPMSVVFLAAFSVQASEPRFELIKLADGIYAAIRTEPPGLTVNANAVFIINPDDVVVVDTTLTPGTAREEIAALKRLTNKPVKYVINTHWHDDHIMGNQAYKEAFPGVEFIAHVNTKNYLPTTVLANRQAAMSEQGCLARALRWEPAVTSWRLEQGSRPNWFAESKDDYSWTWTNLEERRPGKSNG